MDDPFELIERYKSAIREYRLLELNDQDGIKDPLGPFDPLDKGWINDPSPDSYQMPFPLNSKRASELCDILYPWRNAMAVLLEEHGIDSDALWNRADGNRYMHESAAIAALEERLGTRSVVTAPSGVQIRADETETISEGTADLRDLGAKLKVNAVKPKGDRRSENEIALAHYQNDRTKAQNALRQLRAPAFRHLKEPPRG